MNVDIVVGLQHGDEGKGKVTHHLLRDESYTHCVRYNGGCNAGHTIYHNGEKFVTHLIPAGVFYGVKSIIGPGCVVDIHKFFKEIKMLENAGIDVANKIFIAKNAHIVQSRHVEKEIKESKLGTTRTGNGNCYSEKYSRVGKRAEDFRILEPFLIDMYEEFYILTENAMVLCEGAQGFFLDIDHGDYPYVTSSHCGTAGALLSGFPPQSIRNVYGVAKAYETYVGAKKFQPTASVFKDIQRVGEEVGATTGRARQCKWTNLCDIEKAVAMNGVTTLIINKMDVLQEVGEYCLHVSQNGHNSFRFSNEEQFKKHIRTSFQGINVIFSSSPERI